MIKVLLLCEESCPVDALVLTQDFGIGHTSRQGMIWDAEMLEKGPIPNRTKRSSGENFGSESLEWAE